MKTNIKKIISVASLALLAMTSRAGDTLHYNEFDTADAGVSIDGQRLTNVTASALSNGVVIVNATISGNGGGLTNVQALNTTNASGTGTAVTTNDTRRVSFPDGRIGTATNDDQGNIISSTYQTANMVTGAVKQVLLNSNFVQSDQALFVRYVHTNILVSVGAMTAYAPRFYWDATFTFLDNNAQSYTGAFTNSVTPLKFVAIDDNGGIYFVSDQTQLSGGEGYDTVNNSSSSPTDTPWDNGGAFIYLTNDTVAVDSDLIIGDPVVFRSMSIQSNLVIHPIATMDSWPPEDNYGVQIRDKNETLYNATRIGTVNGRSSYSVYYKVINSTHGIDDAVNWWVQQLIEYDQTADTYTRRGYLVWGDDHDIIEGGEVYLSIAGDGGRASALRADKMELNMSFSSDGSSVSTDGIGNLTAISFSGDFFGSGSGITGIPASAIADIVTNDNSGAVSQIISGTNTFNGSVGLTNGLFARTGTFTNGANVLSGSAFSGSGRGLTNLVGNDLAITLTNRLGFTTVSLLTNTLGREANAIVTAGTSVVLQDTNGNNIATLGTIATLDIVVPMHVNMRLSGTGVSAILY